MQQGRRMFKRYGLFSSIFLFFFGAMLPVFAEDNSAFIKKNNFTVSGYIDGSYNYLLNNNHFTSGTYDRVNDLASNGFTLQQAAITLANQPTQGLGGLFNVIAGRDAYNLSPVGINPNAFHIQNIGLTVPQAYLQYTKNNFVLIGGEVLSLCGLELFDYTQDTNFSRSILYGYAQAGSHVGLRGIQTINDKWSIIAGLSNGWNTIERIQDQKAIELAIDYQFQPRLSFRIDDYSGRQYLTDSATRGPMGWRNLLDFYTTFSVTDKLTFAANYDYGTQSRATLLNGTTGKTAWYGIAGYMNYLFNNKWNSSFRGEIFNDPNGYRTGVRQNWRELTLTLAYLPLKNLQFRAETRRDFSNVRAFLYKNSLATSHYQQSFALEMLYQF